MIVRRIGGRFPAGRLWSGGMWLGVLSVLLASAAAGIGLRHVYAQSEQSTPAADTPSNAAPSDNPAPVTTPANPPSSQAVPAPATPARPITNSPEELRKREVANECANLLKLATDLKTEIDKTTKDELSLTVVRKADEIEQLAHKVRSGTRLTAGKD